MKTILITGATGQIGTELTRALRSKYGGENVIAAGHRREPDKSLVEEGPFCRIDVTQHEALEKVVAEGRVDTIFHLASLLSADAEKKPQLAWDVNMGGLLNVLEISRTHDCAVFFPSSIGAFGPLTPPENTPQDTIQRPNTMYGVTKVSGELLCDYYHQRYGVDTRGVRYPGLISYQTPPTGGTTDYAVHIFYEAIKNRRYECFLAEGTRLDMMYMPDAIKAAIDLMEADSARLIHRNSFNVTAMSFAPIDPVRQAIAESWPRYMDDSAARQEWDWQPDYDLDAMVDDMLDNLSKRL
jgi:nucleoside-diphosphate-sugar epimerase